MIATAGPDPDTTVLKKAPNEVLQTATAAIIEEFYGKILSPGPTKSGQLFRKQ